MAHQRLLLKRDGEVVCEMGDDARMLGFYSVESGNEIHVIDTDPFSMSRGGGLTDVSLIEKYRMYEETYGACACRRAVSLSLWPVELLLLCLCACQQLVLPIARCSHCDVFSSSAGHVMVNVIG